MRRCVRFIIISLGVLCFIPAGSAADQEMAPQKNIAASLDTVTLPPLPYPQDALEPYISTRTMNIHYGKHQAGYVEKLNRLISGTSYQGESLVTIILNSAGNPDETDIFNNASQAWNHIFFWNSMNPRASGAPEGVLLDMIEQSFGSFEAFKLKFKKAADDLFGSGWVWLVKDGDTLRIISMPNADNPMVNGLKPILVLDVWEHAYYLDYQNRRGDFVSDFLDYLVSWDFAALNVQ